MSDNYWNTWFDRKRNRGFSFLDEDIFKNFEKIFSNIEEYLQIQFKEIRERTPKDLITERTMPNGSKISKFGPYIYGYSITIGSDGKPQIREFGNLKPSKTLETPKVDIKEKREPLVDIMQTDGEIKVIAELPGIDKKDIKLNGTESSITISVNTPKRKYYKEIKLPVKVDTKKTKASHKNGVLEIKLHKKKEEKPKGEPIIL